MIRRPPRSTQSRSSAASDVYKRQDEDIIIPFSFACFDNSLCVHTEKGSSYFSGDSQAKACKRVISDTVSRAGAPDLISSDRIFLTSISKDLSVTFSLA